MSHRLVPRVASLAGALIVSFVGSAALAQHPPVDEATHAVDEAIGAEHPLLRRVTRHTGGAHDWTVTLPTRRGTCYEIIARASGASRVMLALQARRARVAEPVAIATSSGVARTRFCASLPGSAYSAQIHADGAATWAVAMHVAPNEPEAPSARPVASAPPPASPAPTAVVIPVGGVENDYVAQQIRTAVQARSPRAIVAAQRFDLATNQAQTVDLPLVASHCIVAVAAAVPSASDVNLELSDPAGNRVAEDSGHRGTDSLSFCPPYSGSYRLSVRMFAGHGLTGIQAFEVH